MTADAAMAIATLLARISNIGWPDDGTKHKAWVQILAAPCNEDIPDDIAVATAARLVTEYSPEKISPALIITTCRTKPERPVKWKSLPPPEDSSGPALKKIYFPPDNGHEQFPVAHPDEAERERFRLYYAKRAVYPATLAMRADLGITAAHFEQAALDRENEKEQAEEQVAKLEADGTITPEERAVLERAQARLEQMREQSREKPLSPLAPAMENVLTSLGARMELKCTCCGGKLTDEEIRAYVKACMLAGKKNLAEPPRRHENCDA